MTSALSQITQPLKQSIKLFSKISMCGKILLVIVAFLLMFSFFKSTKMGQSARIEGFQQSNTFVVKTGTDIYDDFYAEIYDHLVFNVIKNDYEIGEIVKQTAPTEKSKILDIGCGTGHHSAELQARRFDVLGIDISPAMISSAKKTNPDTNYKVADALNPSEFNPNSYTHILCLYFTIYYFKDKRRFFDNCMKWLMPGGRLVVHLVNETMFDPILPPGNPLLLVSPQKYAKERITNTVVKFDDFKYRADFKFDAKTHTASFIEKFTNDRDGKVRKNEHVMYMDSPDDIVAEAQDAGFIFDGRVDLVHCQYEYQYLYVFEKPN